MICALSENRTCHLLESRIGPRGFFRVTRAPCISASNTPCFRRSSFPLTPTPPLLPSTSSSKGQLQYFLCQYSTRNSQRFHHRNRCLLLLPFLFDQSDHPK